MKDAVKDWATGRNNAVVVQIGGMPTLEDLNRVLNGYHGQGELGIKVYPTGTGEIPVIFRYGARR